MTFIGAGRAIVSWRKNRPLPEPSPVPSGWDPLRGEATIDQEATRRQELAVDEINRSGLPQISKEEHRRRDLQQMRKWDPNSYAEYIGRHPELALEPEHLLANPAAQVPDPEDPEDPAEVKPRQEASDAADARLGVVLRPAAEADAVPPAPASNEPVADSEAEHYADAQAADQGGKEDTDA